MPDINELLNLTPPVALIAGINFLIWVLKVSFPSFPRNKIPLVCVVIGASLYPIQDRLHGTIHASVLSESIIGFILGGCSVGLHQLFIQQLKARFNIELPGETEMYTKTEISQTVITPVEKPKQ